MNTRLAIWLTMAAVLFGGPAALAYYDVFSANQKFVAQANFDGFPREDAEIKVYQRLGAGKRELKWKVSVAAPQREIIYLSDDGESIVLENHDYATNDALYFFHNGKEVRRYKVQEVMLDEDARKSLRNPGMMFMKATLGWRRGENFPLFSTCNGEPCYCVWYPGKTNWMAWRLTDGERIKPSNKQQQAWNNEATSLARQAIADDTPPRKRGQRTYSLLADVNICYQFLGRFKTKEDRQRLESLLKADDYSISWYGPNIPMMSASSATRARGNRLLADFDRKPGGDRQIAFAEVAGLLGAVEGVIQFPEMPAEGSLVITLVPATFTGGWPAKLPVETMAGSLPDLQRVMETHKLSRVAYEFQTISPGEYRVKVLWKKKTFGDYPTQEAQPEADDRTGESEPITITAGITSQPEMFKCDRTFTGK